MEPNISSSESYLRQHDSRTSHSLKTEEILSTQDSNSSATDPNYEISKEQSESENWLTITSLPEVALVNIMEYLILKDRYHLSMTCRLFYDLFSHPKLWQVANILLLTQNTGASGRKQMKWKLRSVMHHTMGEIVHRYSHIFQHLSLELIGYVQPFDDNCRRMLQDLNEECRLESLSLKLGALASNVNHLRRISAQHCSFEDLSLIVGLIKKATRLKRLNILSWPLHMEAKDDNDIFKALVENEKLKNLESLGIFYVNEGQWTERNPRLPSVDVMLRLVKHFRNLSHLAVRSPMLSSDVLLEIASNKKNHLSLLQILIVFSRESEFAAGYNVPEISSKAWAALKISSPGLRVEYRVLTRIHHEQLSLMFKSEVPLTAFTVLCYGRCDQELIDILIDKYKGSLEKFVSMCDSSDCDESLVLLVKSCTQLKHLTYHGNIHYRTVMRLVDIIKEKRQEMTCFEFKESNILTGNETPVCAERDIVIARDEARQEYYLVGLRSWHQDEDERKSHLHVMTQYVCESLGHCWKPA